MRSLCVLAIKYRQARDIDYGRQVAGLKLWMAVWVPDGGRRGEFDWVRIACDAAVAGLQLREGWVTESWRGEEWERDGWG